MLKKAWEVSGSLQRNKYITISSVIWTVLFALYIITLFRLGTSISDFFQCILMAIILIVIWYVDVRFNPFVFRKLRKVNVRKSINQSIKSAKQGYAQENTFKEGIEYGAINGTGSIINSFILKPFLAFLLWPLSAVIAICTINSWVDQTDYQFTTDKTDKNEMPDSQGKQSVVSNSQELNDAIAKATPNSVISLKAGHYVFTSKYSAVKNLKIIGESRENTFLQIGTALQAQINSVLVIENLSISRKEEYGDNPIIGLVKDNSKLVINNCEIKNSNENQPMIIVQSKNSSLEVNNVTTTRVLKKAADDITILHNTVAKIKDSAIQFVKTLDETRLNAENSEFRIVTTEDKSEINLNQCTVTGSLAGGYNGVINVNNSVCDFISVGDPNIMLFNNAEVNISSSTISSKNDKQPYCQLEDQSKLELNLINYTVKQPLLVECNDSKKQLSNPQNVPVQIKSLSAISSQNN